MGTVGTHCILEMFDCPVSLLDDVGFVKRALAEAAKTGLSTLLNQVSHRFHPQGVTAVGLLAESHLSIHTWPEYQYAGADMFTCGHTADPKAACLHLVNVFKAGRYDLICLPRGDGTPLEDRLNNSLITST